MFRQKAFVCTTLMTVLFAIGCGPNQQNAQNHVSTLHNNQGAYTGGAVGPSPGPSPYSSLATPRSGADVLPRSVAGPPVSLNIPRRIQPSRVVRVTDVYGVVHFASPSRWSGRTVTIYYVPSHNVMVDNDHYDLRTAVGVQQVATAVINRDGTWQTEWRARPVHLPEWGLFFLARSDAGELGLARIRQVQHW